MPVLDIIDGGGKLLPDPLPVVYSVMQFPNDKDRLKREMLDAQLRVRKPEDLVRRQKGEGGGHNLPRFKASVRGKNSLGALVGSLDEHFRDGFLAGHWLTYFIFARNHGGLKASTSGWVDYVATYLAPTLKPHGGDWDWIRNRTSLRKLLEVFWPVAHLWAAATYNQNFRYRVFQKLDITSLERPALIGLFGSFRIDFLREAAGFLEAGRLAGAYADPRSKSICFENVWTLPDCFVPVAPVVNHPDHLIKIDFDKVAKRYHVENDTDLEDRAERRQLVDPKFRLPGAPAANAAEPLQSVAPRGPSAFRVIPPPRHR